MITVTKGNQSVTRQQLRTTKIPVRGLDVSAGWLGVNHGYIANTVVERVELHGYELLDECWYTNVKTDTKSMLLGAITIRHKLPRYWPPDGIEYQIGMRHDNFGRFALSFVAGAKVTICSNGLFLGDCMTKRRHTIGFKLNETIDDVIEEFEAHVAKLPEYIAGLKSVPLNMQQASHIITEAHRLEVLPFRHLEYVYEEWYRPTFAEFHDWNAWSLYNAFTHAFKQLAVPAQYQSFPRLKKLFDTVVREQGCLPSIRLSPCASPV